MNTTTIGIELWDVSTWPLWFTLTYVVAVYLGLEIVAQGVIPLFSVWGWGSIAKKGKHLDNLEFMDNLYININKILTLVFTYHAIQVTYYNPAISWKLEEITIFNTVGSLVAFYIFYDFFYMNFHKLLHVRSLYSYVHKHHHRQKAPTRGNYDAINVHPFEFVVGEYLHLLAIYVIPSHVVTVVIFILFAAIFASLNHTRIDVNIFNIYSVAVHDIHHGQCITCNYGQYIMLWDKVFGTFKHPSSFDNKNPLPEDTDSKEKSS